MASAAPPRDLTSFFDPRSIAVVGASNDPGKWGHWLAAGALRGKERRAVYLVNRAGGDILGHPAHTTLGELPEDPELVVVAVPFAAFGATIDAALARGARAIVAVNAGFGELGSEGEARQCALAHAVRAAGASLIGPNCLGVVDNTTDLQAAWLQVGVDGLPAGPIGLISQSGTIALDVAMLAREVGLGVSRFASLGNQADVTLTDLVRSFAAHEATRLIALYCEDFRDGRAFLRAVQDAVASGKPVVLLAAGGSEASARAARSHTGSMTSDERVVEAVCRATGAVKVGTPAEMVDVAQVLLRSARPRGRRVAVVSDGGGHAVVSTDAVSAAGFRVEPFSDRLRAELTAATDPTAGTSNPVDLASSNVDPNAFERVVKLLAASGEVDAIVMAGYFGGWDGADAALAKREAESGRAIAETVAAAGLPLVVQSMGADTAPARALRDAGAPLFRNVDPAVRALGRATAAAEQPLVPVGAVADSAERIDTDGYFAARGLLADAGIPFPVAERVETAVDALAAGRHVGYPVVLKAVSLLHKSDAGGVALDLAGPVELREAFDAMHARIPVGPYAVEAMATASHGVELIIGCRRDARFGPVLLVGIGGTYSEILRDVALTLAPAPEDEVRRMLLGLRGAALLTGARGAPPVDVDAVAAAAARLSEVAARHPAIAEIEINPLLADPEGAIALDARIIARADEEADA